MMIASKMVGQITGKIFDHPIEKDCVSDLFDLGGCRTGPVRQVAGPENAAIQNLAALQCIYDSSIFSVFYCGAGSYSSVF